MKNLITQPMRGRRLACLVALFALWLYPAWAQEADALYQLVLQMKTGERTAYLFTERPRFTFDAAADIVHFQTNSVSFDIAHADFDRFLVEPVAKPDPLWTLFVWEASGQILGYAFAEHPVVTFSDEAVTVTTSTTTVYYRRENFVKFTLNDAAVDDITVGITTPPAVEPAAEAPAPDRLSFDALQAGEHVSVYDSAGRLVTQATADGVGHLRLSMQQLRRGTYIIKSERITFKIQKQ